MRANHLQANIYTKPKTGLTKKYQQAHISLTRLNI